MRCMGLNAPGSARTVIYYDNIFGSARPISVELSITKPSRAITAPVLGYGGVPGRENSVLGGGARDRAKAITLRDFFPPLHIVAKISVAIKIVVPLRPI